MTWNPGPSKQLTILPVASSSVTGFRLTTIVNRQDPEPRPQQDNYAILPVASSSVTGFRLTTIANRRDPEPRPQQANYSSALPQSPGAHNSDYCFQNNPIQTPKNTPIWPFQITSSSRTGSFTPPKSGD